MLAEELKLKKKLNRVISASLNYDHKKPTAGVKPKPS